MKTRLTQLLACPVCHVPLQLEINTREEEEIVTGLFRCSKCGGGVPHP